MYKNKKFIVKELIIIPFIIMFFTLVLDRMQSSNIYNYAIISDYFLTESTILFDEMKVFFTSILLLMAFELLIYPKIDDNFIVMRIISLVLMLLMITTIFNFFISSYNKYIIYICRIIIIYIGQLSFITLNNTIKIKNASVLSTLLIVLMSSFFVLYRYL